MNTAQIVAKLHKTRATIYSHIDRGNAISCRNGEPNVRSCELVDRYNTLKRVLVEGSLADFDAWKGYCEHYGSHPNHDGYDMFA